MAKVNLKEEIISIIKAQGFDLSADAEAAVVKSVKFAFELIRLLVPKVSKGLGGIIGPLTYIVEPEILKLLDSIDGHDSPDY